MKKLTKDYILNKIKEFNTADYFMVQGWSYSQLKDYYNFYFVD